MGLVIGLLTHTYASKHAAQCKPMQSVSGGLQLCHFYKSQNMYQGMSFMASQMHSGSTAHESEIANTEAWTFEDMAYGDSQVNSPGLDLEPAPVMTVACQPAFPKTSCRC